MLLLRVVSQVYGVAGFIVSLYGVSGLQASPGQSALTFAAGGCLFCAAAAVEVLFSRLKA